MPQEHLPTFPDKPKELSSSITVHTSEGQVYYYCGLAVLFTHTETDLASFRLITSQIYLSGHCKQAEIVRFFHVTKESVKRSVKRLTDHGAASLFKPKGQSPNKKPRVLTEKVLLEAQEMINAGIKKKDVAVSLGILPNTFYGAFRDGRLYEKKTKP